MTVYKIYHAMRIEATDSEEATNRLIEQNGIADELFTANKNEALNHFNAIKESLGAPHPLGKGIYWFDGVILEKADDCDDGENLESAFYTGIIDIISCAIGKESLKMKKLYFVVTNGYNMCVSDDGEVRRVISNECVPQGSSITEAEAIEWLNTVEDDSSWECYEEPIDEFTRVFDNKVVASIESDI